MNDTELKKVVLLLSKCNIKDSDFEIIKRDLKNIINKNFYKYEEKYGAKIRDYINELNDISKFNDTQKKTAISEIRSMLDVSDIKGYDRLIGLLKIYLSKFCRWSLIATNWQVKIGIV